MDLHDLDPTTRGLMVAELDRDLTGRGLLHLSPRLTARGCADWQLLLRLALGQHDAAWLAEELQRHGRLRETEEHLGPGGQVRVARVPGTAALTIAEGEVNRYYARGVCKRALAAGLGVVEVYRAKPVAEPRPSSAALVGQLVSARKVLDELRWHASDVTPPGGVPGGPNSGISVRLPRAPVPGWPGAGGVAWPGSPGAPR